MKFRAKLYKSKILLKLVQNMMKIHTECVMHITPKKIRFIVNSGDIEDGIQVFYDLPSESFFENEFSIQSIANNEIQFQIQLENLRRVLLSAINSNDITIRLTKKQSEPYLHFVIKSSSSTVVLYQDIPIILLTTQQLAMMTEPILPDPQVYIQMPDIKTIQNVIDKMKNLSEQLVITISMKSQLTLQVESPAGSITTHYTGLSHPLIDTNKGKDQAPDSSSAIVDIKKILKVLHIHQLKPEEVVCCIFEGKCLLFHVIIQDVSATYYLPIIIK
ncbi:checkpoint clamp complex protein [Tieghemostelium lacteum]|uniref:Checkpoint protein n=1 Tax=Tieghemostelium lacteum TaxID=361077 RepID=A0A151ZSY9_TIELA|nr:checkpoint clamp complex protein [Tieghemostelium lacteum]|eukprot:KYQ96894.1 checkpoint clamp complex protein [Tieghemostelium lacteum]